ncbi:hypothetical protein JCM1840_005360 [Sporobolomyces johnsonii]
MTPSTVKPFNPTPELVGAPVPTRTMTRIPLESSQSVVIDKEPAQQPAMAVRGGGIVKDCLGIDNFCC